MSWSLRKHIRDLENAIEQAIFILDRTRGDGYDAAIKLLRDATVHPAATATKLPRSEPAVQSGGKTTDKGSAVRREMDRKAIGAAKVV